MSGPTNVSPSRVRAFRRRLLDWYGRNRRDLPWRKTTDPYRIWVSEVMLQQTRVDTVIPYYERFLAQLPTVRALASARADRVLKLWENLGYYSRARNLHAAAKAVVVRHGGMIPRTGDELRRLPGVGEYTVGAVLSIAFGVRIPAVDGNVRRVLARVFAVEESVDEGAVRAHLGALAGRLVPRKAPGTFNQALMELGAMTCTPRSPRCQDCPLHTLCVACERGVQNRLPVRARRAPTRREVATAAVIRNRRGEFLVAQRPHKGLLGGMWKFPGGMCGSGEALPEALRRTVKAEVGLTVRPGRRITSIEHAYTHFRLTLHAFRCVRTAGEPHAAGCVDWRWVGLEAMDELPFSKADRQVVDALRSPH